MKNKDVNSFIEKIKEQEDIESYILSFINDSNIIDNPIFIKALVSLILSGKISIDSFFLSLSEIEESFSFLDNLKILEDEEIIFLVDNELIKINSTFLDDLYEIEKVKLIERFNKDKIIKNNDIIYDFLILNRINNSLLPSIIQERKPYVSLMNNEEKSFIKETFSKELILDNPKNFGFLLELFVDEIKEDSDFFKLIEFEDLHLSFEPYELPFEFLKSYVRIHYEKLHTCLENEITFINNNEPTWVKELLLELDFKPSYHYSLLDNNYLEYHEIFKRIKMDSESFFIGNDDLLTHYFNRHANSLSEESLELMFSLDQKIALNILYLVKSGVRKFSSEFIKKSFNRITDYLPQAVNSLKISEIDFQDLVYEKVLDSLKKGIYQAIDFNIDFINADISKMSEFQDEDFYIKLIKGIKTEEEFLILYDRIQSEAIIRAGIESKVFSYPVLFIINNSEYNVSYFLEEIELNYIELSMGELSELIKRVPEPIEIVKTYKDFISLEILVDNIYLFNYNEIEKMILWEVLKIEDIKNINHIGVNSILFKKEMKNNKNIEEFIEKRMISEDHLPELFHNLEEKNILKKYFNKIVSNYNSEKYLSIIIKEALYFNDNKKEYFIELLEQIKESHVLYEILDEYNNNKTLVSDFIKYKSILSREHLSLLSSENIPIEYFIGRIDDISTNIKVQEDSKGIHLFLENGIKLLTYSTFSNKFINTKYEFTENDFVIFNFIISNIIELPKRLKVAIARDNTYLIRAPYEEMEINILNLSDLDKWFEFYNLHILEVDVIRINKDYIIDFGVGKDKREQTVDFLTEVRKLNLTQLDNLIQNRKNFNLKRGYGIEAEFSVQCEENLKEYDIWSNLDFKKLIKYIDKKESDFFARNDKEEYISLEKKNKDGGRESLIEDFEYYLQDKDARTYEIDEEFDYIGSELANIVSKYDKKRKTRIEQDYYSSSGETWDLKVDSSVGDCDIGYLGIEIASPILYGKEDLILFKKILKELIKHKEIYLNNAGVHVHHDVKDYKEAFYNEMEDLRKELYPIQEMLFNVVSSSRFESSFCKKYNVNDLEYSSATSDKDMSINFKPNDTIEFRMKEGTTDVEDIANWVALTHDITDKIVKDLIKKGKKTMENKKTLFDKIILAAQAVTKRNVVNKDQIETLMEMYHSAKEFQAKSEEYNF